VNTILQAVYTAAGVCVVALVLGFVLGTLVDAVVEFVSALRTRREVDDEIHFLAVDVGEIVDPDEPIPFLLADELGIDGQAVSR